MGTDMIILKDAFKQFTLDQDKIITPRETLARFKKRLRDMDLDILKETVRIDNRRLDIPVFFSQCGKDAASIIGTKKQMGKGATPEQAEASAVMELAERFSFFSFSKDDKNFTVETSERLGDQALSFELIAKSVHDESEHLEKSKLIYDKIPMKWTKAFNLTRQTPVLVPFSWFYMINEFNGPSAGNCQEEALLQGICEIVERHVSSLVSRGELHVPGIDPQSVTDVKSIEMLQKYKNNGIEMFLSDFTLDMGIPTIGALAYDPSTYPRKSEIVWTAGTTPDPEKALSRALTEVAQLAGDFNTGSNYVASGLPKPVNTSAVDYILSPEQMVDIGKLPNISNGNIRIEVENCIGALAERGFEVIVINTTHAALEIPAFYTIVPGAHFRERASGTSVAMFSAKLITETQPAKTALAKLMEMDELLPGKYFIHFYQGMCRISLHQYEKALDDFNRAIDDNPTPEDIPSIYSYMGVCLKEMGKYPAALGVLEKGEAFDPDRTDIHNLKGFCYFKLKQHEAAISSFKKVIALNPNSAIDYANIASNYRDLGDATQAIKYYKMALNIDPGIEFAIENLLRLELNS
ncbi:MAG: tetratricopeptide repeat protein [Desulfobacteraceae bacterium]|nr:tetratricopeptide repeat protein [Desulfobacteraceae bacterium]